MKGIGKTTLDRVGNAIASGVAQGNPARVIAQSVNAIIGDPGRAMTIAVTETNSAYNQASLDQYAAADISKWEWLAYDDCCSDCAGLEGTFDMTNSQLPPPLHPSCRCSVAAVV